MEYKTNSGVITAVKQEEKAGVPVGIIEGYIATWDIDQGNDRFVKGAFSKHLAWMQEKGRNLKLKDGHERTVGYFPIKSVREDERGLFGVGEINLDVQQGRELYSLAKQGAITDLSIGYKTKKHKYENDIRVIEESEVWEGSPVSFPMNLEANIVAVKSDSVCVTDLKNMGKSDLVKLYKTAGLSKDAADKVAQFTLSGFRGEGPVDTAKMLNELADTIEQSRRK